MLSPPQRDDWIGLSGEPLPVDAAARWVVLPGCGATVTFTGTSRDHAAGREGVTLLEYEAYAEQAVPRMEAIAELARKRWVDLGRVVLLHRVGPVPLGEAAVVVAVSAPHRGSAFEAARFGIDAVKATVPIWKREHHQGGESWGLEAQHLVTVEEFLAGYEVRSTTGEAQ